MRRFQRLKTGSQMQDLLEEESDGTFLINNATRHPVFTLKEDVDSISVTYAPSRGDPSVETISGVTSKGETEVTITDPFDHDTIYTLTIFTRDLAGNSAISGNEELKFSDEFVNPMATAFTVTRMVPEEEDLVASMSDSVLTGQAQIVVIQAVDDSDVSDDSDEPRNVPTYKGRNADGSTAEVRISARLELEDGTFAPAGSVWFEGKNVVDSDKTDGMATLKAANWAFGMQTVHFRSNTALDLIDILVEHRNAGEDGTSVSMLEGSEDSLYVVAGPFDDFSLSAHNPATGDPLDIVWGQFNLRVEPTDTHGNSSLKNYNTAYAELETVDRADSLNLLDTRLAKSDYGVDFTDTGVEVTFISNFLFAGLPLTLLGDFTIELEDSDLLVNAPDGVEAGVVQVKVNRDFLTDNDVPSRNISTRKTFIIRAPLEPVLSLWVPGQDGNQAGNDVMTPADGSEIEVTVRIELRDDDDMSQKVYRLAPWLPLPRTATAGWMPDGSRCRWLCWIAYFPEWGRLCNGVSYGWSICGGCAYHYLCRGA